MIRKSIHILIIFLLTSLTGLAQSGISKTDSLSNLIKSDKEDTNKLKHLNALAWEVMFQNPDTVIIIENGALALATKLLSGPASVEAVKKSTQKSLAKAYGNIGLAYYIKGEYAISLEYQFKTQELREAIGDTEGLANTYNNIGIVYRNQGDLPKALEYYFKALRLNIEVGKTNKVAHNLNNIGLVYHDNHEYDKSLEYLEQALSLNKTLKDSIEVANNYNNMGNVLFSKGEHQKAIEYYFKALKVNNKIGNLNESAINLGNIGAVYFKDTNYTKALEFYNDALEINKQIENKYGEALNLTNIGEIFVNQKKYKEAEIHLLNALEFSVESGTMELIKENNKTLSTLYTETNRFELALKHYQEYTYAKDSIFNDSKSKDIGRLEMKHEIEKAEKERLDKIEAERKTAMDKKRRKNSLQYSGIVVVLLIIAVMVTVLGFVKVKQSVASGVVFFSFLIFFEFMMILLDPTVNQLSGGEPAYSLLFNAAIAACIFPIHAFFERLIKKRLIREANENKNTKNH